jgi:hypothetical protein
MNATATAIATAATTIAGKCTPAGGGGATFDLATLDNHVYTTGYFVGGVMPEIKIPAASSIAVFIAALNLINNTTGGTGLAGFWLEDNIVVAEASEWIEDRDAAVALGTARGERAIYGVAENDSIFM